MKKRDKVIKSIKYNIARHKFSKRLLIILKKIKIILKRAYETN